jgi:cell division protease FtsH
MFSNILFILFVIFLFYENHGFSFQTPFIVKSKLSFVRVTSAARCLYDVGNQNGSDSFSKRKYHISVPYYLKNNYQHNNQTHTNSSRYANNMLTRNITRFILPRTYPLSRSHHENYLRRLNSKNVTMQELQILNGGEFNFSENDIEDLTNHPFFKNIVGNGSDIRINGIRIFNTMDNDDNNDLIGPDSHEDDVADNIRRNIFGSFGSSGFSSRGERRNSAKKSDNYEVIEESPITFADIGGYDKIKQELHQCVDILSNYTKYSRFNVRIPRGLILEGPPGNGKTLLAKGFAGEAGVGFIPVSGSEFQEKYVGVGASRIRELFQLAEKNAPCVVFIDEIDAVGRKRAGDGESSTSERDSTLNELLVALDGFKNNTGVFLIGATNRVDLLDPALVRPGRIDKQIYIGNPDDKTREAILNIHLHGKPYEQSEISVEELVEQTQGLSGAQIENLLNEAMLNALRENREIMSSHDIDIIMNKMMAGWQATDHQFTSDIVDHIAIHEMGHAIVGILSKHHSKMKKVVINLSSPRTPGYTIFEPSSSNIHTREALFEHLAILLAGRIAEEVCYDVSVTTGAINDFEEAFKLAERMIIYYGMGKHVIYPNSSDKYKEKIDTEVAKLIDSAYAYSVFILQQCKDILLESADMLKKEKLLPCTKLDELIDVKYPQIRRLK